MPFFVSKKIFELYDARIGDLQKQIADLRSISLPIAQPNSIPIVMREADAIISGKEDVFNPSSQEELEKALAEISERDRILSGTYSGEIA